MKVKVTLVNGLFGQQHAKIFCCDQLMVYDGQGHSRSILLKVKATQGQGHSSSRSLKVTQVQGHLKVSHFEVKVILESNGNVF